MKAKKINEFHKGDAPLDKLGLGINDYTDFIKAKCQENGLNPDDFIDNYFSYLADRNDSYGMAEIVAELFDKIPLEDQINFIENDLEEWINEGGEFIS